MGVWRIQRENLTATPPRFEWLRRRPTLVQPGVPAPAGVFGIVEGSVSAELRIGDIRWTWQDASDPTGWAQGRPPHDFALRRKATDWAAMIDGARPVRHEGVPDADEIPDRVAEEADRKRAAREAYRKALAAGTAEDLT